jgi:DNA polymerase-3 subunit delta'
MNVEIPHPRAVFDYLGGERVEGAFQGAIDRRRLHHAWLLSGPQGVGKATFAYRAARRLMGATPDSDLGLLGSRPGDPVCRQIAARAHPDLIVLQRDPEDGRTRKAIPVEEARALPEFFSKTPASAPFRVAIIDTADDLNRFGANAVLKIIEEPPDRGVIFLISNAEGGLLPTLRSRCRRMRFSVPPAEGARQWLAARAGIAQSEADKLLIIAGGAPGRAWRLGTMGAAEADHAARELLRSLPRVDETEMLALADGFRGPAGSERFNILFERLADQIRAMTTDQAIAGEAGEGASGALDRWAQAWELLVRLPREVEGLNLDRVDAFYTVLSQLRAIA